MKTISVTEFRTRCLQFIDEVRATREPIIITKRGKALAKLVPFISVPDDIFGFFEGRGSIEGDIVSPILSKVEWGNLG